MSSLPMQLYKFLSLAMLAGLLLPVQAAVNGHLAKTLNQPVVATLASFVIGTIGVLVYLLVTGVKWPSMAQLSQLPWWAWTGGLLGGFFVSLAALVAPRIGTANLTGLIVTGQLIASIILDHYGFLGLPEHPVSLLRSAGVLLLMGGVYLILRF